MNKARIRINYLNFLHCILNPLSPIIILITTLLRIFSISIAIEGNVLLDDGGTVFSCILCTSGHNILPYISLCLFPILAACTYAKEYQYNYIYMRVQRMGFAKYSANCISQVLLSAGVTAFTAEILNILIIHYIYNKPFVDKADYYGWMVSINELLPNNRIIEFIILYAGICALRAIFYSLLALIFTIFIPNQRAAIAVPLLCWYFNQYMLSSIDWIPAWLKPNLLYNESHILTKVISISEWQLLILVAIITFIVAILTFIMLLVKLKTNGILGGDIFENYN